MPTLNCNIPTLEIYIREQFLYDGSASRVGKFAKAAVFSVASVPGRALGFQVMLENGAVFDRLPVTALVSRPGVSGIPRVISDAQIWDCPSTEVSCIVYDFLDGLCVDVALPTHRGDVYTGGQYVMTFDWHEAPAADNPGQLGHKCAHLINLHTGDYVLYPNNRLCFHSPAWVKKPWTAAPVERPDYCINNQQQVCEARRRSVGEKFFYTLTPDTIELQDNTRRNDRLLKPTTGKDEADLTGPDFG